MTQSYIYDGLKWARQGHLQKAALSFCKAIKINPAFPEAYQRLGEVLVSLKEWDNAQGCFCEALALNPEYAEAYNYLGIVLKQKNCLEKAEVCYRQAVKLKPDYSEAFHNLGNLLKLEERFKEAEIAYLKALELQPELLDTRFSLSTLYLLLGQYDKGWPLYDTRLNWQEKFQFNIPIWQGEELKGRRILLFYEQGFGDMLQFVRYAYKVAEVAATTVWIQKPLERLLACSQKQFSVCSAYRSIDPEQFDFACSLFSLPAKLHLPENTFLNEFPYICADRDIAAKWREKITLRAGSHKKVGIVWAGNPKHAEDQNRSIPFELFRCLLDLDSIMWFSLQVGGVPPGLADMQGNIADYSKQLTDFAETAGVLDNLDLIITVDTAVAHLSGAMGKKTWLLLPYRADWRWGLGREATPWYPTMRLFRQSRAGDWQGVLKRVKTVLQECI